MTTNCLQYRLTLISSLFTDDLRFVKFYITDRMKKRSAKQWPYSLS